MKNRKLGFAIIAAVAVAQGLFQSFVINPFWAKNYARTTGDISSLSPDQLLASLAGFREMVAGILWVRADSFFDQGNYDAILPIMRLVTILDPKQIDVYATGMWHIGYNFTDEESRSDRRYLPSAIAFGQEGSKNNPNTYELFFETGWIWYHKIDDNYDRAVKWLEEAMKRPDMQSARKNLFFRALVRDGQIERAGEHLFTLLEESEKEIGGKDDREIEFGARNNRDTREKNLDNHLIRMVSRGWLAQQRGDYAQGEYDTKPPFDVGFTAKVTVTRNRIMNVVGTWNVLPVGTRVRIILRDAEYPDAILGGVEWDANADVALDPPRNLTYMQDQLFVRDRRFNKTIDMSRDPTMYPFSSENYLIEFYYSPRSAPDHIQDKFGFNGEGLTDKRFLNKEARPGHSVIYASIPITRDQILRQGEWDSRTPTFTTEGYQERGVGDMRDNIIQVPGLRAEGSN
jgi:hypothetical protein